MLACCILKVGELTTCKVYKENEGPTLVMAGGRHVALWEINCCNCMRMGNIVQAMACDGESGGNDRNLTCDRLQSLCACCKLLGPQSRTRKEAPAN